MESAVFAGVIAVNVLSGIAAWRQNNRGDIGYVLYSDHSRRICLFHMVRHLCVALLFAIYQARRDTGNRDTVKSIGPWFILSLRIQYGMAYIVALFVY